MKAELSLLRSDVLDGDAVSGCHSNVSVSDPVSRFNGPLPP